MPVNLYFDGMHGIGDNIIQRAFIKALVLKGHQVWLKTPLPELYAGIPHLYFVRADTRLRTQRKSEMRSTMNFTLSEPALTPRRLFYGNYHLERGGIFKAMEEQFGTKPGVMDLPAIPDPMSWSQSLDLNVSLLSALGQCNRDKSDIREAEKKRASQ